MSEDVLVKVDNVGKRFSRSLKRSLWYGLQNLGSEIGGRRHGGGLPLNHQAPKPERTLSPPHHPHSLRLPPPLLRILQPLRSQVQRPS